MIQDMQAEILQLFLSKELQPYWRVLLAFSLCTYNVSIISVSVSVSVCLNTNMAISAGTP